jgi:hypothetical protein
MVIGLRDDLFCIGLKKKIKYLFEVLCLDFLNVKKDEDFFTLSWFS